MSQALRIKAAGTTALRSDVESTTYMPNQATPEGRGESLHREVAESFWGRADPPRAGCARFPCLF